MATTITSAARAHQFNVPPIRNVHDPRLKKNFFKIFVEWVSTTNHVPKIVSYAAQYGDRLKLYVPGLDRWMTPSVQRVGRAAGIYKNCFNALRVPKDIMETSGAARDLRKTYAAPASTRDDRACAWRKVVRKFGDLSNDVCDFISVGHEVSPVKNIAKVKIFSSWSTFLCSLSNVKDDFESLRRLRNTDTHAPDKKVLFGLGLLTSVSYLSVGFAGIMGAGSVILYPLTLALVCSIASFFFSQIRDPLGQNQDPSKVLALAKRRVEVLPTA